MPKPTYQDDSAHIAPDFVHGESAGIASGGDRGSYGDRVRGGYSRVMNVDVGDWADEPRGGGPIRYRRADDRIRDDLAEALYADGWVDAREVDIAVDDGEITLEGTVPTKDDKRRVEDLAWKVFGVLDVHNRLQRADRERGEVEPTATRAAERAKSVKKPAPGPRKTSRRKR